MGLIYMRISPSGGKYIGQTKLLEEQRWKSHCKEANNSNNKDYNTLLNKAIRKYGGDNFSVIILEDKLEDWQLDEREIYWINYYKTYFKDNENNYNMSLGGSTQYKYSDEYLKSLWIKGGTIKDIKNQYGINYNNLSRRLQGLGITRDEIKQRAYCDNHPRKRKVDQYTLFGQYIKTFNSITEAAKEVNSNTTNISQVCNGKRQSCKNFIWKYHIEGD